MSRPYADSVLVQAPCSEQGMLHHVPRPGPAPHRAFIGLKASPSCRSWMSVHELSNGLNPGDAELQEIMQKTGETPTTTYLGVSPPVRSGCYGGAANPWSHDRSWKMSAWSASHTNLEALRELDSEGESFLGSKSCPAVELVLGAPAPMAADAAPGAAEEPASPAPAGAPPAPAVRKQPSSGGASSKPFTPFTCHTAYYQV